MTTRANQQQQATAVVEERCINVWSRENNEEVETRVYILVGNKLC